MPPTAHPHQHHLLLDAVFPPAVGAASINAVGEVYAFADGVDLDYADAHNDNEFKRFGMKGWGVGCWR